MLTDEQRQLVESHMNLARFIAWRLIRKTRRQGNHEIDQADVIGMAYVGLCEAALRYEARGRFSSFAFTHIWGSVAAYLRQAGQGGIKVSRRLPIGAKPSVASLDAPVPGTDDLYLGDIIPSNMSVEDAAIERVAMSSMPSELRTLFKLRQAGLTQKAVGQIIGRSQAAVARLEALAKRYLEADLVEVPRRAVSGKRG